MLPAFTPFLMAAYICPARRVLRRSSVKDGGGTVRRGPPSSATPASGPLPSPSLPWHGAQKIWYRSAPRSASVSGIFPSSLSDAGNSLVGSSTPPSAGAVRPSCSTSSSSRWPMATVPSTGRRHWRPSAKMTPPSSPGVSLRYALPFSCVSMLRMRCTGGLSDSPPRQPANETAPSAATMRKEEDRMFMAPAPRRGWPPST